MFSNPSLREPFIHLPIVQKFQERVLKVMELGEYSFLWKESAPLIHQGCKEWFYCGFSELLCDFRIQNTFNNSAATGVVFSMNA
jgi:hypothetical protein